MPNDILDLSRRHFLNSATAIACGLALERTQAARLLKTPKKPNILWIMTDQHNPHVTGCYTAPATVASNA